MERLELKNKPLFQATLGDLIEVFEGVANKEGKDGRGSTNPSSKKRYVRGMKELAEVLHCSVPTAQRIKSSGVLDAAISQSGKTIIVDVDLALDLLRLSNKKWGRKYSK
ncbi:DUF3853 family protein [Bacteroides sp.]|uniref:DUF3853 family protein n=1 Tax=Bacteroides sp. TaxID=29523 RepID=UPI0025BBC178|nr:DUF3853 family protein [Bacteroides sp.]